MLVTKPAIRPKNPRFSSGPCAKFPAFDVSLLKDAFLGRSHRSSDGKAKLKAALDGTREILKIPKSHKVGIVPASDTGAIEMAMWSLLGARKATVAAWESFGANWVTDVVQQLKIDAEIRTAAYGDIVDMASLDYTNDVVFTWNGTTSGVRLSNGDAIPEEREGLTICDATSAAFAAELPWEKLDATTFSWQKVLGGEAAHGMLVLSPRAIEHLENYTPPWPLPKIFRLIKNDRLQQKIFEGETINTPSMLAVEDYLLCLKWARSIGGLKGLIERADRNVAVVVEFVNKHDWIEFLNRDTETLSNTSICLCFKDSRIEDSRAFSNSIVTRLEKEGVAYDIASYRDAPPGLRVWCGSTIQLFDIKAMLPWIEWAFESEIALLSHAAKLKS